MGTVTQKMTTAQTFKKARDGKFEFVVDMKQGYNVIRVRTKSGWKNKTIYIV